MKDYTVRDFVNEVEVSSIPYVTEKTSEDAVNFPKIISSDQGSNFNYRLEITFEPNSTQECKYLTLNYKMSLLQMPIQGVTHKNQEILASQLRYDVQDVNPTFLYFSDFDELIFTFVQPPVGKQASEC